MLSRVRASQHGFEPPTSVGFLIAVIRLPTASVGKSLRSGDHRACHWFEHPQESHPSSARSRVSREPTQLPTRTSRSPSIVCPSYPPTSSPSLPSDTTVEVTVAVRGVHTIVLVEEVIDSAQASQRLEADWVNAAVPYGSLPLVMSECDEGPDCRSRGLLRGSRGREARGGCVARDRCAEGAGPIDRASDAYAVVRRLTHTAARQAALRGLASSGEEHKFIEPLPRRMLAPGIKCDSCDLLVLP
jgi:hypothetical protein